MKVNNYNVVAPNVNCTVFGTDENGDQKNFNVQALLALNATPQVEATNLLTSFTILKTNTYFTEQQEHHLRLLFRHLTQT